jgi:RNA polymerase sigma-70 factor (ECF subfamily)
MMKNKGRRVTPDEFDRLMHDAKSGDNSALGELCSHTYGIVYRFVLGKVGCEEDAEDLTSEICTRVVEQLSRVRGSFVGWALRMSSNLVIDYYRRRDVRNRYQGAIQADDVAETGSSAERSVMYGEMRQLLKNLTDEQQQVITLRFMEGFTAGEVAKALDKPPGAIRALQFRALSSLRDMANEEGR